MPPSSLSPAPSSTSNYGKRWKALADADALFTRPRLDLDEAKAREMIDPEGVAKIKDERNREGGQADEGNVVCRVGDYSKQIQTT